MFARMPAFAVLLAIGSSARALEVTEDYWIGPENVPSGQTINVRGDSILTVDFPPDGFGALSAITLWDNAALEVRSGRMNGEVQIFGDNQVNILGGRFAQRFVGNGEAEIDVSGGQFSGLWQFDGGSQQITMTGGRGIGLSGGHVSLDFYSAYPLYSREPDRSILAGFPTSSPLLSTSTASAATGVQWRMHSTEFLAADSNRDGVVDLSDLNLVRNLFGRTSVDLLSSYLGETLPYDGSVDLDDLNRVRNSLGEPSLSAEQSLVGAMLPAGESVGVEVLSMLPLVGTRTVPEPSSVGLLVATGAALVACAYGGSSLARRRQSPAPSGDWR